ncbi:MAG: hypothetical protein JWN35_877 [Frankiales bacterium]|nr:hypothetical protein [Frankiales bacterium]
MTGSTAARRWGSPVPRVRLVAAVSGVAAVALCLVDGWGQVAWWAPLLLAAVVALSEVAVVHLQFGRQRWTFSLTEGALGAAWVGATGSWSVAAVVVGVAIAQWVRHQPRVKVEFNLAQFALATAAGSVVAAQLGGHIPGAVAGMAAFFVVNHTLVGVAVSLTTRRRLLPLIASNALLAAVHTAGNSSIGLLAAFLATTAPLGLFGLLVPLALLWSSYDQQTRRTAEARLFAELARGQEQASGRSTDVSAQVVVTAAARLLGGADVEMVLLAADGPVRYAGDESGVPERHRVDPDAFDEPWVLRALGARGVETGTQDGRPWCTAVLGEPEAPLAVLRARRPRDSAGFGRRETRLAEVLVGQAETWLSVSDLSARNRATTQQAEDAGQAARQLGDMGAATAPALLVLRESADRLVRLAGSAGSAGGVDDIVEELHQVERAVASLLGAIALAAEPDLVAMTGGAGAAEVPTSANRSADWTTTGVLR